jgi:hypothetical protein
MACGAKLVCSYPGPAVAVPCESIDNSNFYKELTSFIVHMNRDVLDSAQSATRQEDRDTPHPRYITQLLRGILLGIGTATTVMVTRIRKRIGDDVLRKDDGKPWRRSALWLVIRVALQTTLYQESTGHSDYKAFMVFLMARILQFGLHEDSLPSDIIFCMRAKMSRRLYKLRNAAPEFAAPAFVIREVHDAGQAAEKVLQDRWSIVQEQQAESGRWAPEDLDIEGDTRLSLLNSTSYISQILDGNPPRTSSYSFQPQHPLRLYRFDAFCEAIQSNPFTADSAVALGDFELAVQNEIDDWVTQNLHDNSSCVKIAACITQYSDAARKQYESNPEDQSIMLLTIFALWVALDKIAVAQCPLLKDYSPEVPSDLFEPLLLRKSQTFKLLTYIEEHLRHRHLCASLGSIFSDEINDDSFSVRYFKASKHHQTLLSLIEKDANLEREEKLKELMSKNALHKAYIAESALLKHKVLPNRAQNHDLKKKCHKCSLEKKAGRLQIAIHEWPLPVDPFQAKAVVFELDCPLACGLWRATTYQILRDICVSDRQPSTSSPVQLDTYHGLQKYVVRDRMLRITLASTSSFPNSRSRVTAIPSDESAVCVNNDLQYRLFDKSGKAWVSTSSMQCRIVPYCTLQLPKDSPYRFMQYAVDGTSHTSNQVLANQSECPKDLNLHEYIAFASLRSGQRLQWLNIARELRAKSMSFYREEVHTLLTQAAWQIGHLSEDGHREWHAELTNKGFGLVLLKELCDLTLSVKTNWQQCITVRTVIALTSRLLSSANDAEVRMEAHSLLREARSVTYEWMHQLSTKLQESNDGLKINELRLRLCEMALACRSTYDIDPGHLLNLVPSDVAILVECAIVLYDNTPTTISDVLPNFKRLLDRDRRLSRFLEPLLCQRQHWEGLDDAIVSIWGDYHRGSGWQQLKPPNNRWLKGGSELQDVQFNLLEGQLLINGRPLSRLPKSVVEHTTYSRIFGQVNKTHHSVVIFG